MENKDAIKKTNQANTTAAYFWQLVMTAILVVILISSIKGMVSIWRWSDAQVERAQEQAQQETFKRKEAAAHYYELVKDYDMLIELLDLSLENEEKYSFDSVPDVE